MTQSKHKAAKTLVHRLAWAPYGDRVLDNLAKTGYTSKLTSYVKQLLGSIKDNDPQLLKVRPPPAKSQILAWRPLLSAILKHRSHRLCLERLYIPLMERKTLNPDLIGHQSFKLQCLPS
jgi:hypothetical protein